MTPNKGQLIFDKIEANKGLFEIPLFAIFREKRELRDFVVRVRLKWKLCSDKTLIYNFFDKPTCIMAHDLWDTSTSFLWNLR